MLAYLANALILIPAAGFVVAAGTGVLIRVRRARADKLVREGFSLID